MVVHGARCLVFGGMVGSVRTNSTVEFDVGVCRMALVRMCVRWL